MELTTEDFDAENSHSYKIQCGKDRRCRALAPKNPPWKITSYTDRRRFFRRTTFLDSVSIQQVTVPYPPTVLTDLRCHVYVYEGLALINGVTNGGLIFRPSL